MWILISTLPFILQFHVTQRGFIMSSVPLTYWGAAEAINFSQSLSAVSDIIVSHLAYCSSIPTCPEYGAPLFHRQNYGGNNLALQQSRDGNFIGWFRDSKPLAQSEIWIGRNDYWRRELKQLCNKNCGIDITEKWNIAVLNLKSISH